MADAKPVWSALYQSLTSVDTEHYGYRRSSIYEMSTRCIGLRMRGKLLKVCDLVAREGVEPPTPAFSGFSLSVFLTTLQKLQSETFKFKRSQLRQFGILAGWPST